MRPRLPSMILFLCGLSLVQCQFRSSTPLRVATQKSTYLLDWALATDPDDLLAIHQIMEGATRISAEKKLELNHLESIDVQKTQLTFQLKKGILWNDGQELTADDYRNAWIRVINPETQSPYAPHFFSIQGAREWNEENRGHAGSVRIEVLNRYQWRVTLNSTQPMFLQSLSLPFTFPIRADLINREGSQWSRSENLVTLGTFQPQLRGCRSRLCLKRTRLRSAKDQVQEIQFIFVSDLGSALTLFDFGQLDILPRVSAQLTKNRQTEASYRTYKLDQFELLEFDPQGVTSDARVRQAIALAIDSQELVKTLGEVHEPKNKISTGSSPLAHDPVKARELLREAGLQSNLASHPIRLTYFSTSGARLLALELQRQLKEELEVNLELKEVDEEAYSGLEEAQRSDLHRRTYMAYMGEPLAPSIAQRTPQDLTANEIILSAKSNSQVLESVTQTLIEEKTLFVPLYQEVQISLVHPQIQNLTATPAGLLNLSSCSFPRQDR